MADRTQRTTSSSLRTVVDPKMSLSLWLRAGRAAKGLSLDDVAKITKIQPRILERLEAGKLEGLPAEVFVRGFVRSYARCCGLDEAEALDRYSQAAATSATSTTGAGVSRASALVDSMSELAPASASRAPRVLAQSDAQLAAGSLTEVPRQDTVVEVMLPANGTLVEDAPPVVAIAAPAVEPPVVAAAPVVVEDTSKKKRNRRGKGKKRGKQMADGTPSAPLPAVRVTAEPTAASSAEPVEIASELAATAAPVESDAGSLLPAMDATADAAQLATPVEETSTETDPAPTEVWSPKMPVVTPSVPWRRPTSMLASTSTTASKAIIPSIVIDDADPESAEREIEERGAKEPARRSFLPPILLDREDRSARQGGLTLAVIILLIAATLTLSYLMRRPSSTGDGVTQLDDGVTETIAVA